MVAATRAKHDATCCRHCSCRRCHVCRWHFGQEWCGGKHRRLAELCWRSDRVGTYSSRHIAVLEWQRDSEQRALRALLRHLLDDAYEACTPFQCANPSALEEQYGKTVRAQVEEVQAAITRIHVFLRRMVPDTVTMMKVSDVLATLSFAPSENELTGLTFYPNDADLGGLNALGHDVRGTIDTARALLT